MVFSFFFFPLLSLSLSLSFTFLLAFSSLGFCSWQRATKSDRDALFTMAGLARVLNGEFWTEKKTGTIDRHGIGKKKTAAVVEFSSTLFLADLRLSFCAPPRPSVTTSTRSSVM